MTGAFFQPTRRSTGPSALARASASKSNPATPRAPQKRTSADPLTSAPPPLRSCQIQVAETALVTPNKSPAFNSRRDVPVSAHFPADPSHSVHVSTHLHTTLPPHDSTPNISTPSWQPRHDVPMTPHFAHPPTPGAIGRSHQQHAVPPTPGAMAFPQQQTPHISEPHANFAGPSNTTFPAPPPFEQLPRYLQNYVRLVIKHFPQDDGSTRYMQKLMECVTHLGRVRRKDLEPFCRDCFELYKLKYSLTLRSHGAQEQNLHSHIAAPEINPHLQSHPQPQPFLLLSSQPESSGTFQEAPSVSQNPNLYQNNPASSLGHVSGLGIPHSSHPTMPAPFMPTERQHNLERSRANPSVHVHPPHEQAALSRNVPPTLPPNTAAQISVVDSRPLSTSGLPLQNGIAPPVSAAESAAARPHPRVSAMMQPGSEGLPTGVQGNKKSGNIKKEKRDMDNLPLDVCKKLAVEDYIFDRQVKFRHAIEVMPTMTKDRDAYIIWQSLSPQGRVTDVILPTVKAHIMQVLMNDSKLLSIHLNALRFLWASLIGDGSVRSGAVFYHGVGYPTRHLLYLFARLYYETFEKCSSKRVLIICTATSVDTWQANGRNLFPTPGFHVGKIQEASWYDDVKRWDEKGGVLLCTVDDMTGIFLSRPNDFSKRRKALSLLVCPGPDVVVVDEASQICSWDTLALGIISGIRTPSKLALTSVPFGGNLTTWYPVVNWTCPRLLGSQIDFWCRYLRPVADAQLSRVDAEQENHAQALTKHLWRRMLSMSHIIGADDRRNALQSKKMKLTEISVVLNLQEAEAETYVSVCRFLKEAISKKDMSRFVALNVLSALLYSKSAVLNVIDEIALYRQSLSSPPAGPTPAENLDSAVQSGEEFRRCFGGMKETVTRVEACLQQLMPLIKSSSEGQALSQKCKALTVITTVFVENGDRVVIFVNSDAIRRELSVCLQEVVEKAKSSGATLFQINTDEPPRDWLKDITSFNMSTCGAVLVAPYGAWEECMEDFGWAFLNATKVIFLDCSWSSSAMVQAIQRVHNFSPFCNLEVVVMYVAVYGTVDLITHELLSRSNFSPEQIQSHSVLLEPEITPRLLTYNPDAPRVAENVPIIGRNGIDHPWYQNVVERLTKLKMSGNRFALNTIQVLQGQYDTLHEMLSGSIQRIYSLDWPDDCDLADDTILPFVKSRLGVLANEARRSFQTTRNLAKVRTEISSSQDFQVLGNSKRHGLLATWKRYYSLYEGGGLDKEKLSKLGHPVVESDERQHRLNGEGREGGPSSKPSVGQGQAVHSVGDERPRPERNAERSMEHNGNPRRHSAGERNSELRDEEPIHCSRDMFDRGDRGFKRRRGSYPEDYDRNQGDQFPPNVRRRGDSMRGHDERGEHSGRSREKNGRSRSFQRDDNRNFSDDRVRSPRPRYFSGPLPEHLQTPRRGSGPSEANGNDKRPKGPRWPNVAPKDGGPVPLQRGPDKVDGSRSTRPTWGRK